MEDLPISKPLFDQMFRPAIHCLVHFRTETTLAEGSRVAGYSIAWRSS